MKRIFTFGLMLASVFALTNCTEELVDPTIPKDEVTQETTTPEGEGIPFQVYASLGTETKTEGYSDGGVLKTKWVAGDKISVFYAKVTDGVEGALTPAPTMFEITADNLDKTMFTGQVGTDFDENATYNWYFVYDATKNAPATISEDGAVTVTIGSPSQIQVSINDNSHIGSANNCPMWGTAKNISGKMKPRVQMKHLASLVAISVKNDGFGGDIKIKDVEFSIPEVIETDLKGKPVTDAEGNVNIIQEAFPIVGEFQFNILDGNFKAVTSGSYTSKVELQSAYPLPKENGNTATFYLAIRPFKETKTISFKVNSSTRSVTKAVNFESGKRMLYNVPVKKLTHGLVSDALELTSRGDRIAKSDTESSGTHIVNDNGKIITTTGKESTIIVNGHEIEKAYILGTPKSSSTEGTTATITITGFLKDLLPAIPVGFYVSGWNNEPSEMTLNKVSIWIPQFTEKQDSQNKVPGDKTNTQTKDVPILGKVESYYERTDVTTTIKTLDFTLQKRANHPLLGLLGDMFGGSEKLVLTESTLLNFAPSLGDMIPFKNIPAMGYYSNDNTSHNVITIYDDNNHKSINETNLNNFLSRFGASTTALNQLLTLDQKDIPGTITFTRVLTEDLVYDTSSVDWSDIWHLFDNLAKLSPSVVSSVTSDSYDPAWPPTADSPLYDKQEMVKMITTLFNILSNKKLGTIALSDLIGPTPYSLIHLIRDAKISIELGTTSNGPCVVFWGLDANATN